MHKAKKEVLVKKSIKVELVLLEKLSHTDPEDNAGRSDGCQRRATDGFSEPEGAIVMDGL